MYTVWTMVLLYEDASKRKVKTTETAPDLDPQFVNISYHYSLHISGYFTEIGCPWNHPTVYAHRYYLHTHHHGMLLQCSHFSLTQDFCSLSKILLNLVFNGDDKR